MVFNNKGKPVRQYEPFFSATHLYEPEREMTDTGVSPILFYDPAERAVATLHPNHTWEKVVFDPWQQETWDVNDTIMLDPRTDTDIAGYVAEYFKQVAPQPNDWKTWLQQRSVDPLAPPPDTPGLAPEKKAAVRTLPHADTPMLAYFDTLGRPFLTLAHNGFTADGTPIHFPTRIELDIEGNQREVRDANDRIVMRYDYDMLGSRIHQASMEAGARWMLNDVAGKPIRAWDSRGHAFRTSYDLLRRPLRSFVTGADPANPNQELLTERLVYGEQHPQDELRNLRGKLYLHLDQAGVVSSEAHDFKGNLRRATRRLAQEYKQALNWSTVDTAIPADSPTKFTPTTLEAALAPRLEADTYISRTTYDALNRPIQLIAPRSDQPSAKRNVVQPVYNEANLLERVHVWLDHPSEPIVLLNPDVNTPSLVGVSNIDYDAKGQRQRIEYKNGATTRYTYDPETFRLIHLYTRRSAAFTEDCGDDPPPPRFAAPDLPPPGTPCGLQNLHYTYDPVGNITDIRDDAQPTIYFAGQVVAPHCDYTYDAIYRLITATGREQIGQAGQPETTWNDEFRVRLPHPGDGQAMRNYTEAYAYDAVGNFEQLIHHVATGNGWTRRYTYDEDSLTEPATLAQPAKKSNRLSSTTVGSGVNSIPEPYTYDAHGNMTRMNHLPLMQWDYRDQLQATAQQVITTGVPETTWYVYDASGQRVRKVTERAVTAPDTANGIPPKRKNERMYLGGFEIYRDYENDCVMAKLERETLHIMDDKQRIALVETQTFESQPPTGSPEHVEGPNPQPLVRYQFGNHLGSASLELDDQAQIISYEEYTPYGSTAYQAVRSQTETPKRYRYTGKERDEESGLYYHGARYYVPWLGRWCSTDPSGLVDSLNSYGYVSQNPIKLVDPDGRAEKPSWLESIRQQAVLGTILGVRQGVASVTSLINPFGMQAVREDAQHVSQLLSQGNYQRAFDVATGFSEYIDIHREGEAMGSPGTEQAMVMVGHASGSNQAVETRKGETRSGEQLKGVARVARGFEAGVRLASTTLAVAGGVQSLGSEVRAGLPGSSSRAMNKALLEFAHEQKVLRVAGAKETLKTFREEAVTEIAAADEYMEIKRNGSNRLKNKTKVVAGMVDRKARIVTAARNGQQTLGPATNIDPVLNRALENCGENALGVLSERAGRPMGSGENVTFFAIKATPSRLPKKACLNCQAQFPLANFASGRD